MCLRVALILETNYSSSIILSRSGGKSRELSRRGYSMSQLCSIHHDIPVTLHTPGAYGQCSVFDHNGDKQSAVLGTRYGTWWPLYGRFEVGWLQPLQHRLSAGISSVAPVLVLRNRDLCHVQLHPTWFGQLSQSHADLLFVESLEQTLVIFISQYRINPFQKKWCPQNVDFLSQALCYMWYVNHYTNNLNFEILHFNGQHSSCTPLYLS